MRKFMTRVILAMTLMATGVAAYAFYLHFQARVGHTGAEPNAQLRRVRGEFQMESHTCGLHAIRGIYQSYRIDPDQENLRVRLGVDVKANPLDKESTGTLQPDLLRVLTEDHFLYSLLALDTPTATDTLVAHLSSGNRAMLLIRTEEKNNLHWVIAARMVEDRLEIVDSLFKAPYQRDVAAYVENQVLSAIMVQPLEARIPVPLMTARAMGVADMLRSYERYTALTARDQASDQELN